MASLLHAKASFTALDQVLTYIPMFFQMKKLRFYLLTCFTIAATMVVVINPKTGVKFPVGMNAAKQELDELLLVRKQQFFFLLFKHLQMSKVIYIKFWTIGLMLFIYFLEMYMFLEIWWSKALTCRRWQTDFERMISQHFINRRTIRTNFCYEYDFMRR